MSSAAAGIDDRREPAGDRVDHIGARRRLRQRMGQTGGGARLTHAPVCAPGALERSDAEIGDGRDAGQFGILRCGRSRPGETERADRIPPVVQQRPEQRGVDAGGDGVVQQMGVVLAVVRAVGEEHGALGPNGVDVREPFVE